MLSNNFRFILRRFGRQKLHTSLHIIGLTIGLSVCLLIGMFLQHELSYDTYHEKADRTYRVGHIWVEVGEEELDYSTPFPLATTLRSEVPDLEHVVLAYPLNSVVIEVNEQKRLEEDRVMITEPEFLDVFDVEILEGDGHKALREPYQALLTTSTAEKFFGRENAMGKTFLYEDKFTITVAGIIKDFPNNTHLPANILLSYIPDRSFMRMAQDSWGFTAGASTYIVLKEGAKLASVEASLKVIYDQHTIYDEDGLERARAELQALSSIHLEPKWDGGGEWVKAIAPSWLWFFGVIGLIVLALACINFINLSTAQALSRAKEVGIRKTVGANRKQLIGQFIGEAFLLIGISSILAIIAAQFSLPYINDLINKQINFNVLYTPEVFAAFLLGITLTTLLTGLYPAWLTSKFQPALALKKGSSKGERSAVTLRKALVVTQFTISGALLVALLLMSQQMKLFFNKNLGFDKDNVVTVQIPDKNKKGIFAAELAQIPEIADMSFASAVPSENNHDGTIMSKTDINSPDRHEVNFIFGDEQYPDLYQLRLIAGRLYTPADTISGSLSLPYDERYPKVIVNEALIKELEYDSPEAALHQRFQTAWNGWQPEIIGVVEDFVTSSLHEAIQPTILMQNDKYYYSAGIRIKANSDMQKTLAAIQMAWKKTFPAGIYDITFLDQKIAMFYQAESRLFSFFKIFAGLAMLISCFGLWGLATFAAFQRTKEIGIRKVLGASVSSILNLLSKDFLKLVAIAFVLAIPLSWYFMQQWLQNFAYHIDIHWSVFVMAGALSGAIAFLTISFQSLRAALANPVQSLRNE